MSQFSFVGKEIPRPDAIDKVAGRAQYIHDMERPGMLYGKIKFSDYAHARIVRVDTSKAERLPGVKAVITGFNTPEIRIGFLKDNPVLKKDKVRQFRDEVAAVAALDPEIAEEAVELIEVEYEELPGVFSPEDALKEGAPLVHELDPRGKPKKDNYLPIRWRFSSGGLDEAKRRAKYIAEGSYETQIMHHVCMGTAGCIAEFDLNNNLRIITKTQIPFLAQNDFKRALELMGLRGKNVRVLVPTLGGGFGSGLDTHAYEYIAILLAYRTGRPVKIVFTREEEFSATSPRQPVKGTVVQGCDENGRLLFREVRMVLDNGAYTSWGATTPSVMMLPITSLYKVPNVFFDARCVYTNNTFCQAMRGYGNPQATFFVESNLDQLAEEAGIDPLELRMINRNEPGEETPMGLKIGSCGLKECMEKVAERLNWKEKRGKKRISDGKARGVGMASLIHTGGGARVYRSDATGVILKLDDFGNVSVISGGVEMGQGFEAALVVATAEALGVTPDKVRIVTGDTDICPWDVGTHASRGAYTSCKAVIMASQKARKQIFELASAHFMKRVYRNLQKKKKRDPDFQIPELDYERVCDPSEFDLKENYIYLKEEPENRLLRVRLDEILREAHYRSNGKMITVEAFFDPENEMIDMKTSRGNLSEAYIFGSQGAEVEVDLETGKVRVLHFVAAHDVGRVINRQTLRGQVIGGLVMGLGYALSEDYKREQGRNINPDLLDYKIFSSADMDFPIDVEFIESDEEKGPFGAKGVGEPGLVPAAPAIANAIYDAIGVRITSLPITPEKIFSALRDKR